MPKTQLQLGIDIQLGGYGSAPGQFKELRAMAFDADNNLYVLDGKYQNDTTTVSGNARITKFKPSLFNPALVKNMVEVAANNALMFLDDYSVDDAVLGVAADMKDLAVLDDGTCFVTYPVANAVYQYNASGAVVRGIPVEAARACCRYKVGTAAEKVAVIGAARKRVNGVWQALGGANVTLIDPTNGKTQSITLSQRISNADKIWADAQGNFYIRGDSGELKNRAHKFSPAGQLLDAIGGGTDKNLNDGSELRHAIAVDSTGKIYSYAGNQIVYFDSAITTLTQRQPEWGASQPGGDPFSIAGKFALVTVDRTDRVWAGAPNVHSQAALENYHFSPAIARLKTDFFDPEVKGVRVAPSEVIGLVTDVTTTKAHNVSYDLNAIPLTYTQHAGILRITSVDVGWKVQNAFGAETQNGSFNVPIKNGVTAKKDFTITPPKYGWYTLTITESTGGKHLRTYGGRHMAVTREYAGMKTLTAADKKRSFIDAPRQMFAGLPCCRYTARRGSSAADLASRINAMDVEVTEALANGATVFIQFENKLDLTEGTIAAYMARFKDRIKYWEILNEPDVEGIKPPEYLTHFTAARTIIKGIDSTAKVGGPSICGIKLVWMRDLYELGFKNLADFITIHDYEGEETIDDVFWPWKYQKLRGLMAQYGDEDKEIWQTERALGGIRHGIFLPLKQAVGLMTHTRTLKAAGVPRNKNIHYYMNLSGYGAIPTGLWTNNGPLPGILTARTEYAATDALQRPFTASLNFGSTGNKFLLGQRYTGQNGASTLSVSNTGTHVEQSVKFNVTGASQIESWDAFGNVTQLTVTNGQITVTAGQLPTYLFGPSGVTVTPEIINWGVNLAPHATITNSVAATTGTSITTVNNEVVETLHDANPYQTPRIFEAPITSTAGGAQTAQNTDLVFDQAYSLSGLLVRSQRPDNPHSAVLDYDVLYDVNGQWQLLNEVRTSFPTSEFVENNETICNTWLPDNNLTVLRFAPITTTKLRFTWRKTTFGFLPDQVARAARKKATGAALLDAKLQLKEIEVFGVFPSNTGQVPHIGNGNGLKATYFDNNNFTGTSVERVDNNIAFWWGGGSPDLAIGNDTWSARWEGEVQAQYSETYTISCTADDSAKVWLDGNLLFNSNNGSASVALVAGQKYALKVEYVENGGGAGCTLYWQSPSTPKRAIPKFQLYNDLVVPDEEPVTPDTPPAPPEPLPIEDGDVLLGTQRHENGATVVFEDELYGKTTSLGGGKQTLTFTVRDLKANKIVVELAPFKSEPK